jgi:mRNA interferase MazF
MRRGDVIWIDLDRARGAEASKVRPAVVVSNDGANTTAERLGRGVVTVVPVTLLPRPSKAQAEHVRAVAVGRVGRVIGRLSDDLMARLDDALRLHLGL